jgi:hippurate hydrolase
VLALAEVDALGAGDEHANVVGVDIREAGQREDLRADLDALDMQEASGVPWASKHAGKHHACFSANIGCTLKYFGG